MLAALISLPHFSVSMATCFPEIRRRTDKRRGAQLIKSPFSFGSPRAALISLLSLSTISAKRIPRRAYPLPTGRLAARHEFAHARSFRQHLGTRSVSRRRVGIVDDPNCVEHAFHIDAIAGDKEGCKKATQENDIDVPEVVAIGIVDQECLIEHGPGSRFRLT